MGKVITHLKTLLPLPKAWKDEERTFGLKLEDFFKEFQALRDSLVYKKGTISCGEMVAYGYSYNSAKQIRVVIPMDKLIPAGSYSVKSFKVIMRSDQGNVNNNNDQTEYVGSSSYSVSAIRINNGRALRITLTKSTAFTNLETQVPVVAIGSFSVVVS